MSNDPYAFQFRNPRFLNSATGQRMPNDTGWQDRHMAALNSPRRFERPIVAMISAWATYADEHQATYGHTLGTDYALGPEWRDMARAIHGLLDGETGRLDCGTLSSFIVATLDAEGFEL